MKILLSAYSCEPFKGSEPAVGWNWALTLAKFKNETVVVTRKNNKHLINNYLKKNNSIKKYLKFYYYDLPSFLTVILKLKKNSYFYFFFWQVGLFFFVKNLTKKFSFDYIHHVTFVGIRIPSFLHLLKIPFIFGPISGGINIKKNLRKSFTFKEKIFEYLRDLSNFYIPYSPLINLCFKRSKKIFVADKETLKLIPLIYKKKTSLLLGIGSKLNKKIKINNFKKKIFRICFVGRLLSIKGIIISLKTIKKLKDKHKLIFEIAGSGPLKNKIIKFISENNLKNIVKLKGNLEKKKLVKLYKNSDILLFPSLRDSGGLVILEAAMHDTISAVLNVGGPDQLVDNKTGIKISILNKTEEQISDELVAKLDKHIKNRNLIKNKIINFKKKINKKYTWDYKYKYIYKNLN